MPGPGAAHAIHGAVMDFGHHGQQTAGVWTVSATPSITHISHSGLLRSSVADAICPQISANSRRPRRGQFEAHQMTIEIEPVVVDPYRIVQVELAVGQLCPELWYGGYS